MESEMRLSGSISVFVLTVALLSGLGSSAYANECQAYGAKSLPGSWNWHYPRETPTVRNGNRALVCKNGKRGWLYTRDDIAGQYFVTNTNWLKTTRVHNNLCDAVAQYCAQ